MEPSEFEWDKDIAVRVRNVSKIYNMRRSPRARMMHPILGITRRVFPALHRRISVSNEGEGSLFKNFHALHDVSLDIRKGESWGFIGLNGSGKSTLLKIISGNLRPSTGYVLVDGKVAIIDYSSGISGEFTGRENIYSKAAIMGLSDKQIAEKIKSIEEFADIGDFIDQPAKTYSSGMGARLGFAIMAHMDSDILISDEALAVGDAFFVQKCMRFIHKFMEKGTFIFVSHSINDVMTLCDKAVWLQHGKVVDVGPASDVCRNYRSAVEKRTSVAFQESLQEASNPLLPTGDRSMDHTNTPKSAAPERFELTAELISKLRGYGAPATSSKDDAKIRVPVYFQESQFSPEEILSRSEGTGKSRIVEVKLLGENGEPIEHCVGNEQVLLRICVIAGEPISNAIVGFQIRNDRGLSLVGENSCGVEGVGAIALSEGDTVQFEFAFALPLFSPGDYVLRVGLADGTEDNNALLDVVHEAYLLRCMASGARHGLVGVPMRSIKAKIKSEALSWQK